VAPIEKQFSAPGSYLIDFYPGCEYLVAAANICAPFDSPAGIETQKKLLNNHDYLRVIAHLKPDLEAEEIKDDKAPPCVLALVIEATVPNVWITKVQ